MRKKYTYITLLILLFLSFSSCKDNKVKKVEEPPKPKKPVQITLSTFYEESKEADGYKAVIEAFEASHENIKVRLYASGSGYDEKINTELSAGKGPDIIGLQRSKMLSYIKQGNLKDISSWVDSSGLKSKYYGVNLGYGKYDGKYYGIGDFPHIIQWYYNVDMFKKAGVNEPKNMEELVDVCNKLKKYTNTPIAIIGKDPWAVNILFSTIIGQTVNVDELSKAYTSGERQNFINLAGADEAVKIFNDLVKSGAINKKFIDYDYAASVDNFVKGKSAIIVMGSWGIDKIESMKPQGFKYRAFSNPVKFTLNPNSNYSATAVQVITVNEKGKHIEETMEFMNFLFSEEGQRIFASKNGISGLKAVNKAQNNEIKDMVLKQLEQTDENSNIYMDNISDKMMRSTAERLLQLINNKLKLNETWKLIVDESHA